MASSQVRQLQQREPSQLAQRAQEDQMLVIQTMATRDQMDTATNQTV
jgi:hypothetical protein